MVTVSTDEGVALFVTWYIEMTSGMMVDDDDIVDVIISWCTVNMILRIQTCKCIPHNFSICNYINLAEVGL